MSWQVDPATSFYGSEFTSRSILPKENSYSRPSRQDPDGLAFDIQHSTFNIRSVEHFTLPRLEALPSVAHHRKQHEDRRGLRGFAGAECGGDQERARRRAKEKAT